MRQTELKRTGGPKRKTAPKQRQPKRDWSAAREKVDREEVCRLGRDEGCLGKLEAAHIIGRECDGPVVCRRCEGLWHFGGRCSSCKGTGLGKTLFVHPEAVVPLCTVHHKLYDAGHVDLLPALETGEQVQAVLDAGSIALAFKRTAPLAYRRLNQAEAEGPELLTQSMSLSGEGETDG